MLYSNLEAKNSEIAEVAKVSNCSEFIDQGRLESIDDSNSGLLKELETNSNSYVAIWGQEEYQKQIDVLKKLVELDAKKGDFLAIDGDIDNRSADKKDTPLNQGYDI